MNWHIEIELKANRYLPGWLMLLIDGVEVLRTPCLGIADRQAAAAHGNALALERLPYGDTPTGGYTAVLEAVPNTPDDQHSLGDYFIRLIPVEGDALVAGQCGRIDLGIHAGTPSSNPNLMGGLRCTHGCIRTYPEPMALIASKIIGTGTVSIREVE